MSRPDIDAIRARIAAATPGPWHECSDLDREIPPYDQGCGLYRKAHAVATIDCHDFEVEIHPDAHNRPKRGGYANAPLIVNAPTDLAALCDELERYRFANRELEQLCGRQERELTDAANRLASKDAEIRQLHAVLEELQGGPLQGEGGLS